MKHSLRLVLISFFTIIPFYSNSNNPAAVMQQITEQQIKFVDFVFSDLLGILREVTVPVKFVSNALENGLKFDGSSIPGCTEIFESDMHLKPDLSTFIITPSPSDYTKGARIICDVYRSETVPYENDPRYRLKEAQNKVRALGLDFLVGPELEFFLFKEGTTPLDSAHYFQAETNMLHKENKKAILYMLEAQNIPVEKWHHEVACGQNEISIRYGDALSCADRIILVKHIITTIAQNMGWRASFMAKPFADQNGSGMHVHFSLRDMVNNVNAFYDVNDEILLSVLAKRFIAGVLNRVSEITALLNPTVNSYKRLKIGYEAPVYICWGKKNRSALIRIPEVNEDEPNAVRAEIRSPDGMSNPYLLLTALLEAGLAGIEKEEQIPAAIEENLYKLTPHQITQRGIASLPTCLEQALMQFKQSNFIEQTFGKSFVDEFLKLKTKEVAEFNRAVTDWEQARYL